MLIKKQEVAAMIWEIPIHDVEESQAPNNAETKLDDPQIGADHDENDGLAVELVEERVETDRAGAVQGSQAPSNAGTELDDPQTNAADVVQEQQVAAMVWEVPIDNFQKSQMLDVAEIVLDDPIERDFDDVGN